MSLQDFEGTWTVSGGNSPVIFANDTIRFAPAAGDVVVRVRRGDVTFLLAVGFLRDDNIVVPLPFGEIRFFIAGGNLEFIMRTRDAGGSPEGGGTSVGPPVK